MVDISLPDLGEGTKEATIKEILVKVGQRVDEYEDLCEVFTDKLVAKIPSTASGVVTKINYTDDTICSVGHPIMTIETEDDAASPVTETQPQKAPTEQPATAGKVCPLTDKTDNNSFTSPAARILIARHGLDVNLIPATGAKGRVLKEDVLAYLDSGAQPKVVQAAEQATTAGTVAFAPGIKSSVGATITHDKDSICHLTERYDLQHISHSRTIPFLTFSDEIDATKLVNLMAEMREVHTELNLLPFIIKACSLAIEEYPIMNTLVDNEDLDADGFIQRYVIKKQQNFSVANDGMSHVEHGIVVKSVQGKSILQIQKDMANSTKGNATFSITSVADICGTYMVPQIVSPQVAVIAIGAPFKKAGYNKLRKEFEPISAINFSISADHRVLDGATVARFAGRMKTLLENPNEMLLKLY